MLFMNRWMVYIASKWTDHLDGAWCGLFFQKSCFLLDFLGHYFMLDIYPSPGWAALERKLQPIPCSGLNFTPLGPYLLCPTQNFSHRLEKSLTPGAKWRE